MTLERVCLWIVVLQGIATATAIAGYLTVHGVAVLWRYRHDYYGLVKSMVFSKTAMREKSWRLHEQAGRILEDWDQDQAERKAAALDAQDGT